MNLRLLRTYYLLDEKIRRKGITPSLPSYLAAIPPEDRAQIQQYVETIAAILMRSTTLECLHTLEDIERMLAQQTQISEFPALIVHLLRYQINKQRLYFQSPERSPYASEYLASQKVTA